MVRLSGSPVVNVTSGGGEAGFFVLDGRLESRTPSRRGRGRML
jgi:hypothetical protein